MIGVDSLQWGSDYPHMESTFPRSQQILEDLDRANLFLIPIDDKRHWYRYHQLFREFLREPWFIPKMIPVGTALQQFLDRREPIAMVADEHGGLAGLVTLAPNLADVAEKNELTYRPIEELIDRFVAIFFNGFVGTR